MIGLSETTTGTQHGRNGTVRGFPTPAAGRLRRAGKVRDRTQRRHDTQRIHLRQVRASRPRLRQTPLAFGNPPGPKGQAVPPRVLNEAWGHRHAPRGGADRSGGEATCPSATAARTACSRRSIDARFFRRPCIANGPHRLRRAKGRGSGPVREMSGVAPGPPPPLIGLGRNPRLRVLSCRSCARPAHGATLIVVVHAHGLASRRINIAAARPRPRRTRAAPYLSSMARRRAPAKHATGSPSCGPRRPWTIRRARRRRLEPTTLEHFARLYATLSPAVFVAVGLEATERRPTPRGRPRVPAVAGKFGVRGGGYS